MIDLHTHTTYSDGTDTLKELLIKAQQKQLEILSITDHNTCEAYEALKQENLLSLYQGNIIIGCELTTSYQHRMIEIIAYDFDIKKMTQFLKPYNTKEYWKKRNTILGNRLMKIVTTKGYTIDKQNCIIVKEDNIYYGIIKIYQEIKKHKENEKIMEENIFNSKHDFIRKGVYNPNSNYYLGYDEFYPSLKEVITIIHNSGGIAFLAHPYQYEVNNIHSFLKELYNNYEIDGIECFYTTFSKKQTNDLITFAQQRKLLQSGGSDYHGKNKQNHELGIGRGNLNIEKNIIKDWKISFFKTS